ncbi:hypothetical protein LguiB_027683 [Lonicera macranthoides]
MVDFIAKCFDGNTKTTSDDKILRMHTQMTRGAIELQEAGVMFSKVINLEFLQDVKFINGVLKIPVLHVNFLTETRFRNMIAVEQSRLDKPKRISGYILLMATLTQSPKVVVLLSNLGIIEHPFIDDKEGITYSIKKEALEKVK